MTVFSNMGVPMLFVQMPLMIAALPVVIFIEAFLTKRWFDLGWRRALKVTGIANIVSTLLGFPLMWIGLVAIQMVVGGGGAPKISEPWFSIYTVTVQAAWLLPFGDRLYWMIPTAGLILLIPAFFLTVFIEGKIYRKSLSNVEGPASISSAIWKMHFASYGFLFLAGFALLGFALLNHSSEQDEVSQPVPSSEAKGSF